MAYAKDTQVPVSKSQYDIQYLLKKAGAQQVGTFEDMVNHMAVVCFQHEGLAITIPVPLPNPSDKAFTHTPSRGTRRTKESAEKEYSTEINRRWRVMLLLIKAKLEAIELGFSTVRREFLSDIRLPSGGTVEQWLGSDIEAKYLESGAPALGPGFAPPEG